MEITEKVLIVDWDVHHGNGTQDIFYQSVGFDSRISDPLGRFRVTDEGFKKLTRIMLQIAGDHAEGRLISMLEGGYNLKGLTKAIPAHIETLVMG